MPLISVFATLKPARPMIAALKEGNHISRVLDSISTPDFIASRTLLNPAESNNARHYHDNAHFSFVIKGGCAEKKLEHYERLPGSITWYEAGEPHQITQVRNPSYHINFELPEHFFKNYAITPGIIEQAIHLHPQAVIGMVKAARELALNDQDSENSLRILLINLFNREQRLMHKGIPLWVNTIREVLHDRWKEKITLEELALMIGIHPVTISRYFPVYFSCTLGEYCRELRIKGAIGMMNNSSDDMSAIAYACGFADQSHFIRNFKSLTGMLPSAFLKV
jgi:AraC family transcriptional regulator